ncbi:MAG: hypothetical protein HN531_12850 [Opitutae bacterium]|nr:hypothetical protein [Opitutae bacterium]
MIFPAPILLLAYLLLSIGAWAHEDTSHGIHFKHSVSTKKKPWTNKNFLNDPYNFQFALLSDRTGGVRAGVFSKAVKKLNELQPEFVISVGDLIKGGAKQTSESVHREQWEEFNSFIEGFDMPFFYLPGNHDVRNNVADRIWGELYGVRYYSFTYKDVLFLCLNTQDGPDTKPLLLGNGYQLKLGNPACGDRNPSPERGRKNASLHDPSGKLEKKLSKAPLPKLNVCFNAEDNKLDFGMHLEIPAERYMRYYSHLKRKRK